MSDTNPADGQPTVELPMPEKIPLQTIRTPSWAEQCLRIADEMALLAAQLSHHQTGPAAFPNGSALRQMLVQHLTQNDGSRLQLWQ